MGKFEAWKKTSWGWTRFRKTTFTRQARIGKKELDLKQEHLKQERLNQICLEISQKIESLAEFEFPNEKNEVIKI